MCTRGNPAGAMEDQRHGHRRVVHEVQVRALAVLTQPFAVVGRDDDQGLAFEVQPTEFGHQSPDLLVHKGYLADVGVLKARSPRLRRLVGKMRVEKVRPQEELLAGMTAEPVDGTVADLVSAPLMLHAGVVVRVEALVQACAVVDDEGGHISARGVPRLPKDLGQRGVRLAQAGSDVVAGAVHVRVHGRQDRRMGRKRARCGRRTVCEHRARGGQGVDVGRGAARVPVASQVIRPRRVQRDEQDVEPRSAAPVRAGQCLPDAQTAPHGQHGHRASENREPTATSPRGVAVGRLVVGSAHPTDLSLRAWRTHGRDSETDRLSNLLHREGEAPAEPMPGFA